MSPPLVIGVLLTADDYNKISTINSIDGLLSLLQTIGSSRISVIDGMQRTTAMLEALKSDEKAGDRPIRVEFWIADKVNSLIYRMLVLNTGQVPWEIGRQLETIYGQFLTQIDESVGEAVQIFKLDENRRRVQAGQYQSKNIIELLLLFSSRKSELEIKDKIAEDFARLDAIETTSHKDFLNYFIITLQMMTMLDKQFSRATTNPHKLERLKSGKDVFSSFPAMAGFFSAVSIELFDEPGFKINWDVASQKKISLVNSLNSLATKMERMQEGELSEYIQLQLLEERLSQRSGQVGRFERELFRRAFASMIRNADRLENLEPCWVA